MREEEASADEFFADALRFFGETKLDTSIYRIFGRG
jgi:hypothetical protein